MAPFSRAGQISRIFLRRNATLTRLTRLPSQPVRKIVPPALPSGAGLLFRANEIFSGHKSAARTNVTERIRINY